ncbi:MAG: hypothetical protein RJA70_49 [Pseudomonadota bacterium]|jgi:uncharacterized membrane protein
MEKVVTPFAVAAAALFIAACASQQTPEASAPTTASAEPVKCLGIHECKGKSACGVPDGHACAGQNDCKGKGWIKVSAEECAAKGGSVL